jgi:hypothetical protein
MNRTCWIVILLALSPAAPARAERVVPDQPEPTNEPTREATSEATNEAGGLLRQASLFSPGSNVPWRGSQFVLRNALAPISLDPGADQTHNPYYAMTWSFQPWWWFTERIFVRARLDVVHELTEADNTTYDGEALVEDLRLVVGGSGLYTIPYAGVNVSADLVLTLPTSKDSHARTLLMGIGPGLRLSRSFPLLKGLVVGYNLRFTPRLFSFTTSERETPLIRGRPDSLGTGTRNPYFRFTQMADASVKILDWLGASLVLGHAIDWLYGVGPDTEGYKLFQVAPDQDQRYLTYFELAVSFRPLEELEIGVGYSALHPQQRPASTNYVPFFNRYSVLFVDLKVHAEAVVTRVRRILK